MNDPHDIPGYDATRFDGRVALVTGGGSHTDGIGNGRAAAVLLARRGAKVMVIDRALKAAQNTVAMISSEGGTALAFEADVSREADCKAAVAAVVAAWGRVDVLVNNVGIGGPPGSAVDLDLAAWETGMAVNVTSMVLMARHAIPEMIRQGRGAIVNLSSVAGLLGSLQTGLLYQTSKGAIVNMTRAMATQHAAQGIRANCVAPGMTETALIGDIPQKQQMVIGRQTPLRRLAQPDDIAAAVAYLASDDARFVTGHTLEVNGGMVMS